MPTMGPKRPKTAINHSFPGLHAIVANFRPCESASDGPVFGQLLRTRTELWSLWSPGMGTRSAYPFSKRAHGTQAPFPLISIQITPPGADRNRHPTARMRDRHLATVSRTVYGAPDGKGQTGACLTTSVRTILFAVGGGGGGGAPAVVPRTVSRGVVPWGPHAGSAEGVLRLTSARVRRISSHT